MGMGDGEFHVELREREPGATGTDEATFLIRPNAGLPFAPVAETASGGELSRVALAIAAVGGGETMVFDEIDAGIGGADRPRGRRHARAAGRACPGGDDHAPAADREPRRAALPRREDSGRSDAHADPGTRRTMQRKDEIERMLGGREFLSRTLRKQTVSTLIEFTGPVTARPADEAARPPARRGRRRDRRPHRPRSRHRRGAARDRRARRRQRGGVALRDVPEPRARCCSSAAA